MKVEDMQPEMKGKYFLLRAAEIHAGPFDTIAELCTKLKLTRYPGKGYQIVSWCLTSEGEGYWGSVPSLNPDDLYVDEEMNGLDLALSGAVERYHAALAAISSITLAMIEASFRGTPEIRWLRCGISDQNDNGELSYYGCYDTNGNQVEIEDEGDRFYGDPVTLSNLDDLADTWKAYKVEVADLDFTPEPQWSDDNWLDIWAIRTALFMKEITW